MDIAEDVLSEAGYVFPLQGNTSILAIRPVGSCDANVVRRETLALGRALQKQLANRIDSRAQTHILICVHADDAVTSATRRGAPMIAGPITRLARWPLAECVEGLCVSRAALPNEADATNPAKAVVSSVTIVG